MALDTFAKVANKALKKFDEPLPDRSRKMPFNSGGESNVQALIRVGSKKIHTESCGDSTDLRSYLNSKRYHNIPQRWVGNRINVLFDSAGMLFLLGDTIINYFQHVSKPTNYLHGPLSMVGTLARATYI